MSLEQAMALVNGPTLTGSVAQPTGRLAELFKKKLDDKKIVEELYLAVLCRFPTPEETDRMTKVLAKAAKKQETAEDLMWALLNTPAFLFNR